MKSPKTLKQTLTLIACEVETVRDALRGAVLAIEVERASIGKIENDFEADLQAIMGLGVLLGDLQTRRTRLMELGRRLPSPNQIAESSREKVVALGKKIFETVEHVKNIQAEIYRLARLNLRSASHKVNFAEKIERKSRSLATV